MSSLLSNSLPQRCIIGLLTALILLCASCPVGAEIVLNPDNGHYYESVAGSITWDEANAAALASTYEGLPGHLATITSAEEQAFLTDNLTSGNLFFIGGVQLPGSDEPDGGWTWVTGEAWDYTAWENGEPNNAGGTENVVQWHASPKGWNDVTGTNNYSGYIVEYAAVPEPSSLLLCGIAGLFFFTFCRIHCRR